MNKVCFTAVVLNLNKFLTIDFNMQIFKKMKFSIEDSFNKCDQIHSFLWIWSHLLTKSSMENLSFVQWKMSSTCAWQILCLDYSNLQERRNISKLCMIARGHLLYIVLEVNVCNSIFYERKMFRPKYHWVEIKYLGTIQNWHGQLFCLHDNAFSQYKPAFSLSVVACWRELERLYIYSIYIRIS